MADPLRLHRAVPKAMAVILSRCRLIAAILAMMVSFTSPAATASGTMLRIPAGPMDAALLAFGRQAGISIVFGREAVARFTSPGVEGSLVPEVALQRLLGRDCLTAEWIRPDLVAVKPGCAHTRRAATTPPSSLAPEALPARSDVPPPPEEILVTDRRLTGTRLVSAGVQLPANLHAVTRPEIELSGHQTLSHLLRYVPAISGNSTSTLVTNGGDGSATVTLRGLPASNTLVLLNGRRINPDAFLAEAVDVNTLPLAMIERIEVLKDGASAVYGSDAVAGVVNVQTRRELSGLHADVYIGRADQGGLDTEQVSVLYGFDQPALRWVTGVSWYHQGALYSRERALASSSDERSRGSIDKRSSAIVPAWLTVEDTPLILASPQLDGSSASDFREVGEEDRFEYRDHTSLIVPARRTSVFLDGEWRFTPGLALFVEGQATGHQTVNQLAPTPLFSAFERIPLPVAAHQAWNPFGVELQDVRRRIVELGPRKQHNRSRSVRLVAGLTGEYAGANWDLAFLDSRTRATERFTGAADASRVASALGEHCLAPCVPLNVFGPAGSIDAEMLDWIAAETRSRGRSRLRSASVNLASSWGSLPAGAIDVAIGAEYRVETLRSVPDPLIESGLLLGSGDFSTTLGRRTIWEGWAETRWPLLHDLPGIRQLDAYVAARHSVYNDFGRETLPRFVLHYLPVHGFGIRASYSEAFRAPTLHQLFGGTTSSFEQLFDPCTSADNALLLPGCRGRADPSLDQFLTLKGGNLRLDPEHSQTLGIAFEFSTAFAGFDLDGAVDFYRIRQRDVVDNQAQYIVNENAAGRGFVDRVARDEQGNIQRIIATPINIGSRDVRGVDIAARLRWTGARTGRFELAAHATHIAQFADRFTPQSDAVDMAGTFSDSASGGLGALPDWKASVALRWQRGFWRAQIDSFLVSRVAEVMPITQRRRSMELWAIHNAQVSYQGPMSTWLRVTLGVNNLLDEPPPWSSAAFNDGYDSRTYDITGRFVYLKLERSG